MRWLDFSMSLLKWAEMHFFHLFWVLLLGPEQSSQNNSDVTSCKVLKIFLLFWHHPFSSLYTKNWTCIPRCSFIFSLNYILPKRLEVNLNSWRVNSGNVPSALIRLSLDLLHFPKNKMADLFSTQTEWSVSTINMASWLPESWYSQKL